MAIIYQAEETAMPHIHKREVSKWIKEVAAMYGKDIESISYIFCSDEYILRINNQYLKHDYYTDIITFDYSLNNDISGDIFISTDTVKSNSQKYKTDYNEELHRVIIHGILHLCGINDKSSEERADMTEKENKALEMLNRISTEKTFTNTRD
ncbi:MAG: rRNA maturation RNase YbeY [Candidatus Azobacteroides sp.]|nr:rRNA maturation RNase YbeY [Candidatus Azobacteroides sp.]